MLPLGSGQANCGQFSYVGDSAAYYPEADATITEVSGEWHFEASAR